jgi:hypothetical protein
MRPRTDGWYGYDRCPLCGVRTRQREIEPSGTGVQLEIRPGRFVDCSRFLIEHGAGEAIFVAYDHPEDFAKGGDGWTDRLDRWLDEVHAYESPLAVT